MPDERTTPPPTAPAATPPADDVTARLIGEFDRHLFNEGTHTRLHHHLGAHLLDEGGVHFAVWAPNASFVEVVGDFTGWEGGRASLEVVGETGIWAGVVADAAEADAYKYRVHHADGSWVEKADPFATHTETPRKTASKVWRLDHEWTDDAWMAERGRRQSHDAPIAIYELHLGSWRRGEDGRPLNYAELADPLVEHVQRLGFTHVEFLPVMEHPFDGSWGYQTTGYFAPTSRFGTPQDFMTLVDRLHGAGIGVILDWVPSHFPTDEIGLAEFDGTHLFEHADPRQGFHPDWKSAIFNYGRNEVRSFLLSSAMSWLERYHVDGIRVDAVASMLYLDYSREEGEWIPNRHGGNENLEAIAFLRQLNETVYAEFPDVQTFAEESTAWPGVSRPTYVGGLGFGFKWDMGWMHDTLQYFSEDPVHRRYHQDRLTFRAIYMGAESYCLPLSHDEVVHGKGSLLDKMPGDDWQRRANLRLLLGYQFVVPGKKLLFMGSELGQPTEWSHEGELPWSLLDDHAHDALVTFVGDAARAYRDHPALHVGDTRPELFAWIDASDVGQSVLSFRRSAPGHPDVVVVGNFTPVPRHDYRVGVPAGGHWREVLNSDAEAYGGSGMGNLGGVDADDAPMHGLDHSVSLTLPPLSLLVLVGEAPTATAPVADGAADDVAPPTPEATTAEQDDDPPPRPRHRASARRSR